MECEHKRIKSVNCALYCMDCGKELPPDALHGGAQAREEVKTDKPTPKKRTAKKAN